jgi:hypothetical protein
MVAEDKISALLLPADLSSGCFKATQHRRPQHRHIGTSKLL